MLIYIIQIHTPKEVLLNSSGLLLDKSPRFDLFARHESQFIKYILRAHNDMIV